MHKVVSIGLTKERNNDKLALTSHMRCQLAIFILSRYFCRLHIYNFNFFIFQGAWSNYTDHTQAKS